MKDKNDLTIQLAIAIVAVAAVAVAIQDISQRSFSQSVSQYMHMTIIVGRDVILECMYHCTALNTVLYIQVYVRV